MKSYAYGFSPSQYHISLYSPSFWWWWCDMRHCLCDEIKWDEWCRHRDVGLGCCMGYLNKGTAIPQKSIWSQKWLLSDQKVGDIYCMETVDKGMVHTWGRMGRMAWDFITSLPTICNLKLSSWYYLWFQSWNISPWIRRNYCICKITVNEAATIQPENNEVCYGYCLQWGDFPHIVKNPC